MRAFELAEPRSLADALKLLDRDDPAVRPIAGGTALMLMMKAGLFRPLRLVSLGKVEPGLARIAARGDGGLEIGAMTPMAALEHSPEVARHAPVIRRAMLRLANVRVRNVATVGGCLAHADPHLDLPPVLIALGARIVIASPRGEREIPAEQLFAGYLETVLKHDELIQRVIVPPQGKRRAAYLKVTTRSADDWPALGVAVSFLAEHGALSETRLAVSAATPKPVRLAGAEAALKGPIDAALLQRAGEAAVAEAEIDSDDRGSAAYKKHLLAVYVARAVEAAAGAAG